MKLIDTIVNAIWEGFEADDNCYADRKMDVIDTGGHFETFSMERIAEHVLLALREPGPLDDWRQRMSSLLGKPVRVLINRNPEVVATGVLVSFDEGGEVGLRADDGFIRWSWPNLDITPL